MAFTLTRWWDGDRARYTRIKSTRQLHEGCELDVGEAVVETNMILIKERYEVSYLRRKMTKRI
jgi:hypothetical protein